jgi:hypothetical protein
VAKFFPLIYFSVFSVASVAKKICALGGYRIFFAAEFPPAFCQPPSVFEPRATTYDFAKRTQFSKNQNKPNPLSKNDL